VNELEEEEEVEVGLEKEGEGVVLLEVGVSEGVKEEDDPLVGVDGVDVLDCWRASRTESRFRSVAVWGWVKGVRIRMNDRETRRARAKSVGVRPCIVANTLAGGCAHQ